LRGPKRISFVLEFSMSRIVFAAVAAVSLTAVVSSHFKVLAQQDNAAAPELQYPLGAVRAEDGTTYIVDRKLPGVLKLTDGKLSVLIQGAKKSREPLNAPRCVALDKDGNVLVGDSATREVYRIDNAGKATPLTDGGIGIPMSIAVDAEGDLFVADLELPRLFKVPAAGGKPKEFATIAAPRGVAFDKDGILFVLSTTEDQVFQVTPDGKATVVVPGRPFRFPHNIAVAEDGTVFVTDGYGKCVWKIAGKAAPEKLVSGEPFSNPVGLSISGETLLVVDSRANAVFECDLSGKLTKIASGAE
jgi:sugar lactone lactonase YvrE